MPLIRAREKRDEARKLLAGRRRTTQEAVAASTAAHAFRIFAEA